MQLWFFKSQHEAFIIFWRTIFYTCVLSWFRDPNDPIRPVADRRHAHHFLIQTLHQMAQSWIDFTQPPPPSSWNWIFLIQMILGLAPFNVDCSTIYTTNWEIPWSDNRFIPKPGAHMYRISASSNCSCFHICQCSNSCRFPWIDVFILLETCI